MKTEYSRILLKRSTIQGQIPTIPVGNDINSFLVTDLMLGEAFVNLADGKLFIRADSGIVEFTPSVSENKIGYANYVDTGQSTSIQAGVPLTLTNNGSGTGTDKTFLPTDVTDVWDTSTNRFDWSELSIGDMVDIGIDLDVTTGATDTIINVDINLGTGAAGAYTIPLVSDYYLKNTGLHEVITYTGFAIKDSNTLTNGGSITISSNNNSTVVVKGWYFKVIKR